MSMTGFYVEIVGLRQASNTNTVIIIIGSVIKLELCLRFRNTIIRKMFLVSAVSESS